MSLYTTLEEAIDAAHEEFMANQLTNDDEITVVNQFNLQKYIMQDGDEMWQAEFFQEEGEEGHCLPLYSNEGAQAIFNGDYDESELMLIWQPEDTLYEWDDGEFQSIPPTDTEEGRSAAEEFEDDNSEAERWT